MNADEYRYEHGQESPIDTPAYRVVSLVPSITESLFDLNLGGRIVGITDECTRPAEKLDKLPRLGHPKTPNIRQVIALMPDLVFVNQDLQTKADIDAIKAAEIPVWEMAVRTVPDVFTLLWNIMYAFDETTMVARIRLLEHSYDWVSGSVRARESDPCSVFVPLQKDPLTTFTSGTYPNDLIRVCGGENIFGDLSTGEATTDLRVTIDAVKAAQPEVILLPNPPFTETDIVEFAALGIPAAHNQRIHLIERELLTWVGTRIVFSLTDLPLLLSPDQSNDVSEEHADDHMIENNDDKI